ncbi:VWA domain-containing protein [Niveibacterium sp. COAC-50]|uniref:vWA domain-containing protein n=1 Tax=Niveibacterium sp. COAC-50 TaxID=2729384 RepID=UPI001552AE5D|nr:VWA domain-containing protein [Niveibacterium sp. COAC-50]
MTRNTLSRPAHLHARNATLLAALAVLTTACGTNGLSTAAEQDAGTNNAQATAKADAVRAESAVRAGAEQKRRAETREAVAAPAPLAKAVMAQPTLMAMPAPMPAEDRERYNPIKDNGVVAAAEQPFSTFSIDVDTGAYANVRRFLNEGRLPAPDAVRVEELINYFPYQYAEPRVVDGKRPPFGVTTEVAASPWNKDTLLLRVGIKAFDKPRATLPPSNLVFLVDVSGSMESPDKLPLLKNALKLMVESLRPEDHVSLVTYASGTRVVLPPTAGSDKATIRMAIDQLVAGGSTAGAAGIQLAYQMAQQGYVKDGINRILLATDGDFNVGVTDFSQLKGMVAEKRKSGISLSTLGFGTGNYNDAMMEQVADAGDGNYSYIDTLNEAQKVLVEEASSTLSVVARDVKIQMEFNPGVVAEYRLIGYENRTLAREDFRNDKVDAGEIGAGHTVTALYEVALVGKPGLLGESRYGGGKPVAKTTLHADELGMLRLRYKGTAGDAAQEIATPVKRSLTAASEDLRFAAAVAAFGQQLRGGKYLGSFGYPQIEALAANAKGSDRFGYRGEFVRLVKLASALSTKAPEQVSVAQ